MGFTLLVAELRSQNLMKHHQVTIPNRRLIDCVFVFMVASSGLAAFSQLVVLAATFSA